MCIIIKLKDKLYWVFFIFQEQYIFVHEALLEAILTGDTEIQLEQLPIYFNSLNAVSEKGETKLQQQYSVNACFLLHPLFFQICFHFVYLNER